MKTQLMILGLVLSIVLIAGCTGKTGTIVGNDTDEHGCIGSAGYSWCEAKQKCLRTWEENCTIETDIPETSIPETNAQTNAKGFCNKENVGSVNICENYIEVNSELLGGGAKYYDLNGTQQFTCPVVAPDSMSKKCKEIFEGKLAETFNCEKVCPE
jgi:hypothetical protein